MPLVYDHTPSGLVVAREGADETSVRRALKQLDQRLLLDYAIDPAWQKRVWQVLCRHSNDQPPAVVCRWRDDNGEPLPLSHGLVERVKHLSLDSRAPRPDAEADNRRLEAELERAADAEIEAYAGELVPRLQGKRASLLPRGQYRRRTQFPNVTDIR